MYSWPNSPSPAGPSESRTPSAPYPRTGLTTRRPSVRSAGTGTSCCARIADDRCLFAATATFMAPQPTLWQAPSRVRVNPASRWSGAITSPASHPGASRRISASRSADAGIRTSYPIASKLVVSTSRIAAPSAATSGSPARDAYSARNAFMLHPCTVIPDEPDGRAAEPFLPSPRHH